MRNTLIGTVAFLGMTVASAPAHAGFYSTELGRCMVQAATVEDKTVLGQWIFVAMAQNPSVNGMSMIPPARREALGRKAVGILERLMLDDCRSTAVTALKNEGGLAIQNSFETLGEVAALALMADPSVGKNLNETKDYLDKPKWDAFGKAAGLPGSPQD